MHLRDLMPFHGAIELLKDLTGVATFRDKVA